MQALTTGRTSRLFTLMDAIQAGVYAAQHGAADLMPEATLPSSVSLDAEHVDDARLAFEQILMADRPSDGFETWRANGAMAILLPELLEGYGVGQNEHHAYDVYTHNVVSCDAAVLNLKIRMAALFHDIGKTRTRKVRRVKGRERVTFYNHEIFSARMFNGVARRFGIVDPLASDVWLLVRHHMFHYTEDWTDSAIRRFIKRVGLENVEDLFLLREADRVGSGKKSRHSAKLDRLLKHMKAVIDKDNAFTVRDLAIGGHDLMQAFNLPPSRLIGDVLQHVFERTIAGDVPNERDAQLALAESFIDKA